MNGPRVVRRDCHTWKTMVARRSKPVVLRPGADVTAPCAARGEVRSGVRECLVDVPTPPLADCRLLAISTRR